MSLDSEEDVYVETLDRFLAQQKIEHVDIFKIDTQGFDLEVLLGAAVSLSFSCVARFLDFPD